jgi:hypothetical protein
MWHLPLLLELVLASKPGGISPIADRRRQQRKLIGRAAYSEGKRATINLAAVSKISGPPGMSERSILVRLGFSVFLSCQP